MTPGAFLRNPLADAAVRMADGEPVHVDVSAYSLTRGFTKTRLSRGTAPGFEAVLRFLAAPDGDCASLGLSPAEALSLWQAGLVLLPQERAAAFMLDIAPPPRDGYIENGFLPLPPCVTPAALAALVRHYRTGVEKGSLPRGDRQSDRYIAHNDPAGRVVQRALHGIVERIVGSPIKGSYSYASLYCGGAVLPLHTDRPQCRYSVSLLIHQNPFPADGRSDWPVQLFPRPDAPPVECHQPVGGGLLFRGCDIPHARPALASGAECWVMLLHYVDADFDDALD